MLTNLSARTCSTTLTAASSRRSVSASGASSTQSEPELDTYLTSVLISSSGFSDAFYKANREKYDPKMKPDACWWAKGAPVPPGIETNGARQKLGCSRQLDSG